MLFRSSPKGIKGVKFDIGETMKRAVLKNFAIFTEKHLCWGLFLIKVQISCEYCGIFKHIYFVEHLRTAASVLSNYKVSSKLEIINKIKTVNK